MKSFIQIFVLLFCVNNAFSQSDIRLMNPSFEGKAAHGTVPIFWKNCANQNESPPDLHSSSQGFFGVRQAAFHGKTFVGMVTRDNDTWESIGQQLETPMLEATTYQFSIYLARSKQYISLTKTTRQEQNFNAAVTLRIWGSNYMDDRGQLLAESVPITNTDWNDFTFEFTPTEDWQYIILEAFYINEDNFSYNGNLLLDYCSSISPFLPIKLADVSDFSELSVEELLQLIIECKTDDTNLSDTSAIDIVYDSWIFGKTCKTDGMKALVTNLDSTALNHYLLVYQQLGLEAPILIINKTVDLNKRDNNKYKDVRFLRNSNEYFKNSLGDENIYNKRLDYIHLNRAEIVTALKTYLK